jgi:hypothetical protein
LTARHLRLGLDQQLTGGNGMPDAVLKGSADCLMLGDDADGKVRERIGASEIGFHVFPSS